MILICMIKSDTLMLEAADVAMETVRYRGQ